MKKYFSRILSWLLLFTMLLAGERLLDYALVDDVSSYTRLMMHEFYNQDNIDILCLGASHCYMSVIPTVVSEQTGKRVFNAGSSTQMPDASYALIKEAVEHYDVETVYLEISASLAQATENYKERSQLTATYIISDYMKLSLNKLEFLLNASSREYYANSFFPVRRYASSIGNLLHIYSLLKTKATDEYKNYEYVNAKYDTEFYAGNGYVACSEVIQDHRYYSSAESKEGTPINVSEISDDWKKSMNSIIDYCNAHNVKLVFFDAPISNFQLAAQGNYDDYIDFVSEFVEGKNVDYVEFNLLKKEYLEYKQGNYKDGHHLNMYGAKTFSPLLAKYINGEIPDTAFYDSIDEKLKDAQEDYYGIVYEDDDANNRIVTLVSNVPDTFEYKVEIEKADGSSVLLQDFDTNNVVAYSKELLNDAGTGYRNKLLVTVKDRNGGLLQVEYIG